MITNKLCTKCKKTKSELDFYFSHTRGAYYSKCKQCQKDYATVWGKNNKERKNLNAKRSNKRTYHRRRNYSLLKNFGITTDQYNKLLVDQNNVCKICLSPETGTVRGRIKPLAVDHCHKSGKIRGLLCARCNTFIGLAKENTSILNSAIVYLIDG